MGRAAVKSWSVVLVVVVLLLLLLVVIVLLLLLLLLLVIVVVVVLLLVVIVVVVFSRKSNAHTHISDSCAFALDGVKNVTDEPTNERTRCF